MTDRKQRGENPLIQSVLFALCVSDKQHTHIMDCCNIMLREPGCTMFTSSAHVCPWCYANRLSHYWHSWGHVRTMSDWSVCPANVKDDGSGTVPDRQPSSLRGRCSLFGVFIPRSESAWEWKVDTSHCIPVFALNGITSQNARQIDSLRLKMPHVLHLCATQKNRSYLTKTLNITADGNGLKMQSSVRPF